ncbi:P-loop containing nucleoside triphosphate hydrolase protein, partial [Mycena olivaceomarginata]
MEKDAEQQHQDLVALLANYPDSANSDLASLAESNFSNESTTSLSILPATPQIFHGRELELGQILNTLQHDSPRLVILGTGGIGKTTLASAVLNHPDIVAKFPSRHFVSCHSTSSVGDLCSLMASHIGLPKNSNSPARIMDHFQDGPPTLVILDNLETVWESESQATAEDFLSLLADVPHLALLVTMRGAERPQKVRWSRPFLPPLEPLSVSAALRIFVDITGEEYDEAVIRQLLEFTGNLPLAINLMANVVAYEGCERTLERWESERTRLLSDGCDKRSSLDTSIMISLSGSRMTSDALQLLSLLCLLPDGLSDAEMLQSGLPIPNLGACKVTLLRTALANMNPLKRLTVLVPIREYVRTVHPAPVD